MNIPIEELLVDTSIAKIEGALLGLGLDYEISDRLIKNLRDCIMVYNNRDRDDKSLQTN